MLILSLPVFFYQLLITTPFIDPWFITLFSSLILHSLKISGLIFLNWLLEPLLLPSCLVPVGQDRHPRQEHKDKSTNHSVNHYINGSYLDKKLPISKVDKGSNVHPCGDTVETAQVWILVPTLPLANMAMSCNIQVCKIQGRQKGAHQGLL